MMSIGSIPYTVTHAQISDTCTFTGQYYTGEYQTWCVDMSEELTWWYYICDTIPGYFTGGTTNESGEVVDQIRVDVSQTWCVITGQTLISAYTTWCYMTWGYWTGGTVVCEIQWSWTNQTWTVVLWNGVCESEDIIWTKPISWSVVRNIFDIQWNYSGGDCLSWLSLQLRDHNQQWIDLSILASWATSYAFDSRRLYSFQQSGLYHIVGTNMSGNNYYLYTWQYTWIYSYFASGYKFRLLTPTLTSFYETSPFTIDNQYPTLSWMTLASSWSTSWYVTLSGVVTLSFVASEVLSWLQVTLWSGNAPMNSTVSWLMYTHTRTLSSLYSQWPLAAKILFADQAGNTWSLVYTSALVFDNIVPQITGFVFTESTHGVYLNFTSSKPIKATFNYWMAGTTFLTWTNASYLTAHQLDFGGIQRDQLYNYTLDVTDQVGNMRAITGDFMWTTLGQIVSHVYIVPIISDAVLTGNVATLAIVLKSELNKFNMCKDSLRYTDIELEIRRTTFLLHMPEFKKSQIKVLVNAFTLFVLDQIKKDYKINKANIQDITQKFDKFLVILKLLRDNDNECKQNLSNYHIGQFQKTLGEYNIVLE